MLGWSLNGSISTGQAASRLYIVTRLAGELAMDLLCVICRGANDTSECHLAVFSKDMAFACHFVATRPPPPSHPLGVLVVLTTLVKNYLIRMMDYRMAQMFDGGTF